MGIIQSPLAPLGLRRAAPLLLVALGVGLKAGLLLAGSFPFHADEAIVGLMARHIRAGAWPAFFYGQAYMGSLDATLVALAFALVGEGVLAIRLVQVLLYGGTILATMQLAGQLSGDDRAPVYAGALMAIPAVNVTLYTTVSLGGYGEALLLGIVALAWALRLNRGPGSHWRFLGWGALAGLAFWGFGITLVYTLPAAGLLLAALRRQFPRTGLRSKLGRVLLAIPARGGLTRLAALLGGALLGAAPWLLQAVRTGPRVLLQELFGSAIAGVEGLSWLGSVLAHASNLLLFGTTAAVGLRPPWEVRWLALPLLPFAAGIWLLVLAHALRGLRGRRPPELLLLGVGGSLSAGFLLTPFGADPSGRYFLPLAPVTAVFAADFLGKLAEARGPRLASAALALLLAFNLWGTLQSASRNPPGITTQFNPESRIDASAIPALGSFLRRSGELRGYSTYWVSYPLAFLSREQLVFVPRLPYHADLRYTPRDDRYAPYKGMVEQSSRVAYITAGQPALELAIRAGLARLGLGWQEALVGQYRVFFRLSRPVSPAELGIPGKALQ